MNLETMSSMNFDGISGIPSALGMPTYYQILNVEQSATRLMIREQYLRLKNLYANGGDGLYGMAGQADLTRHLTELDEAFEVLNDDTRRADYDRKLSAPAHATPAPDWNPEAELWKPVPPAAGGIDVIQTSRSTLKVTRTHANGSHNEDLQAKFASILGDADLGDGMTLVRLREAAGVGQHEIQERTKISLEYIRGMENNLFERLPQVAYVKGFMRSYLRYLNVPEVDKIVTAYAARLEAWQAGQK